MFLIYKNTIYISFLLNILKLTFLMLKKVRQYLCVPLVCNICNLYKKTFFFYTRILVLNFVKK